MPSAYLPSHWFGSRKIIKLGVATSHVYFLTLLFCLISVYFSEVGPETNEYKEVAMPTRSEQSKQKPKWKEIKEEKIFPVQKVPWHRFFPRKSVTLFGNKTPFSTLWLSVHFFEFWTRSAPEKCTATANPVHKGNPSGARRRRAEAHSSCLEIDTDCCRELNRVTHSSLYLDTLQQSKTQLHVVRHDCKHTHKERWGAGVEYHFQEISWNLRPVVNGT